MTTALQTETKLWPPNGEVKTDADQAVFVAVPHYGEFAPAGIEGLVLANDASRRWKLQMKWCSILPHGFNALLCDFLNSLEEVGWTHFAMHHADIQAAHGWIDTLLRVLEWTQADVVSSIVPIKDHRGLTSTGYMEPDTGHITRFTIREVHKLPETFNADRACPGKWLMVNTGLWLMRAESMVRLIEEKKWPGFQFQTCVHKKDGKYLPAVLPEDWAFSEACARAGLKVMATRAVKVIHHGRQEFPNSHEWGTWETDQGDRPA